MRMYVRERPKANSFIGKKSTLSNTLTPCARSMEGKTVAVREHIESRNLPNLPSATNQRTSALPRQCFT